MTDACFNQLTKDAMKVKLAIRNAGGVTEFHTVNITSSATITQSAQALRVYPKDDASEPVLELSLGPDTHVVWSLVESD